MSAPGRSPAKTEADFSMTKTSLPTLPTHNTGSIVSSCAAIAVSLCFSGGLWMIMR